MNIVERFVEKINAHDIAGLVELMTADHTFVDSLGNKFTRPAIEAGWKQYFDMVPDYWVRIDNIFARGETAILIGTAGGTYVSADKAIRPENKWETPAVWLAHVKDRKIAEWRIYSDNEPIREKMRRSDQ